MQATISRSTISTNWSLPNTTGMAGAVAGGLTGAMLLVLSPLLAALTGSDVWNLPKATAQLVLDVAAFDQLSLGPLLLGILIVLALASGLGAIFGSVYRRVLRLTTDFGLPIYAGLTYGMLLFMLVSLTEPIELDALMVLTTLFGMGLGLVYTLLRPSPYHNTRESA